MRTKSSLCITLCLFAIASGQFSTSTAGAAEAATKTQPAFSQVDSDSGNTERIRKLFRDGNALMHAGNLEGAYALLLQAWTLRHSSDIAGSLGQVEFATKRYRDAAEHLQWCLAHFPPVESEKVLQATQQLFHQARQAVGELRVSANRDGAAILIDGRLVGATPITDPLFVEPGMHRVEAQLEGGVDTKSFAAEAGKDYAIDLALVDAGRNAAAAPSSPPLTSATSGAPPTSAPVQQSSPPGRSVVPVVIGGAVFALALGAGIALLDSSASSYDDARALQNQVGPMGCVFSQVRNQVLCTALKTASEKGDSREKWGIAALATAGVALVAVPVYWFWPREKSVENTNRAQWRIRGSVAPEYSGLWLAGDF